MWSWVNIVVIWIYTIQYWYLFSNASYQTIRTGAIVQISKTTYPGKLQLEVTSDYINFTTQLQKSRSQRPVVRIHSVTSDRIESASVKHDKTWQKVSIYSDAIGLASFNIRSNNNGYEIVHGYFYSNSTGFSVNCERRRTCQLSKQNIHSNNDGYRDFQTNPMNVPIFLPRKRQTTRRRRQVQLYEIELCLALDYSLYKRWLNDTKMSDKDTMLREMTSYYGLIVNGVDSRFKSVRGSGYVISVLLSAVYVAKDPAMSPWTHLYTRQDPSGPIVSEKSLKALADWLTLPEQTWLQCDHVMALTAKNLAHDGSKKTLGLSYLQSMCTERSVSIIEDHGNMAYISYIAAHELAHSLGAWHDGDPEKVKFGDKTATCSMDDGYIMRPKASSKPETSPGSHIHQWIFSPCSALYFDFYIHHLDEEQNNCLISHVSTDDHAFDDIDDEPNLLKNLDYYCETIIGDGAVLVRGVLQGNLSDICRSVPCSGPNKHGVVPSLPAEGLKCGHEKSCRGGQCSYNDVINEKLANDDLKIVCPFGDEPGHIQSSGMTCTENINLARKCYDLEHECCETCFKFRRYYTSLPDCHYGDKIDDCEDIDCSSYQSLYCCETCAKQRQVLKECKSLDPPDNVHIISNTGTNFEGSVVRFACSHGYSILGNATSICLATGKWTSDVPRCIFGCPSLTPYPFISYTPSDGNYSVGTEVRFTCHHGLVLMGDHVIHCQNDSTWSRSQPVCSLEFSSKSIVFVPENSDPINFKHELTTFSANASYCLIGYSHQGFSLSEDGILVGTNNLTFNYERTEEYRLIVKAWSIMYSSLTATQSIRIKLIDVNDPPTFTRRRYHAHIWMPISKGTTVLQVKATDEDWKQNLTYSSSPSSLFKINSYTGDITSLKNIYIDIQTFYSFTVVVKDNGKPIRSASAVVNVCVGFDSCDTDSESGGSSKHQEIQHSILFLTSFISVFIFIKN